MKKLLVILGIAASLQFAHAQKSVNNELPNRLFTQGKEMFLDNNYVGCINSLEEFKQKSNDSKLKQEADYMIVSSFFYQGDSDAPDMLKDFLEKHPETYHLNQIYFFIGTTHFQEKDWEKAHYWLSHSDIDYLTPTEQEDYAYRMAFSALQVGNNTQAKQLFNALSHTSRKYAEPASYYLAYAHFQDKEFDLALPIFTKLKIKPEYRENSTFYLLQGKYVDKELNEVIEKGKDFILSYPNSNNAGEVYRMIGSSYYQKGDLNNSITNYEKYVQLETVYLRTDIYQLGDSYYKTGRFEEAGIILREAASTEDELGQTANMLLGQSLLETGETTGALLAFDAAARCDFNYKISEEALYNYVILTNRESVSAFGQSIAAFQRFLTEYPNSKYSDQINSALASTLLSTKNYNMALNIINNIKSPSRQILDAKQSVMFQLGVQQFIDGNYDGAIDGFDATINLGTYNTTARNEAFFWRGEAAYRTSNFSNAARDFNMYVNQASPSQDNYALALYNLGYTNFETKNYSVALSNFKRYVAAEKNRQSPNYPDALNRLGDCSLYGRSFGEAERYYSQAASASPSNADYSEFQKAFVMGLQRNYSGKVSALNSMMSRYPDSQYYDNILFEKSRALVMLDRDNEAIATLEQLMRDFPKSNSTQKAGIQLGQLYFNNNNTTKSVEAYKKAISYNPNSEEARAAIQSLEGVYKDTNDISSYANYVNSLGGSNALSATRQDSLTYLAAENVYMKGQKEAAKSAMNKYLQAYPKGVFASDANFYLGNIAFEKDRAMALKHYQAVVKANNAKYMNDALIYTSEIEFNNKNYEAAYEAYEHLDQVASNTDGKNTARLGMLRSAYRMKRDNDVVAAANKLLDHAKDAPDVQMEARFYRAQSLLNLKKVDAAVVDFEIVAKNTRSAYGAESQFILADTYYKWKSYEKAEAQVLSFMKAGTTHEYWMARAVIVLADVYNAKGDGFQSRQYLESLQANYKGSEPEISSMIAERLAALKK